MSLHNHTSKVPQQGEQSIVFYDKMDNDGKGAKCIFSMNCPTYKYVGLDRDLKDDDKHYIDILKQNKFKNIVFLDLAPRTKDEMLIVDEYSDMITIIDHHKLGYIPTSKVEYVYSNQKSACLLTWEYFSKNEPKEAVRLINDRDMWLNKLQPNTNYFFNTWSMMNEYELQQCIYDDSFTKKWCAVGEIRENTKLAQIDKKFSEIEIGKMLGLRVAYTRDPIAKGIISELGNRAVRKLNVDLYAHIKDKDEEGYYSYNLRSLDGQALRMIRDNSLDGGGHDNACGFKSKAYLIEDDDAFFTICGGLR